MEVERLSEGDPARGDAIGGADVEHLEALALIEAAGQLFGRDLGQGGVAHAAGSVAGREPKCNGPRLVNGPLGRFGDIFRPM